MHGGREAVEGAVLHDLRAGELPTAVGADGGQRGAEGDLAGEQRGREKKKGGMEELKES